jgi:hypothetical protein
MPSGMSGRGVGLARFPSDKGTTMTKEATAPIDFGAFIPVDAIDFELLKPGTEEGTGWIIQIAGPGHPQAVAWQNALSKRNLARTANIESQRLNGRKVKPEERDVEETRAENVGWVTSRIVGWSPVILPFIDPTNPTEYSPEMATKIFSSPLMGAFLSQLVDKLADDASFTPRSGKA